MRCCLCQCSQRKSAVSTPHRSETNGVAERAVRRVKKGTSAVSLQSGLDEKWWSDSMECYCYLRNVLDLLADWKTPYERSFVESLKGPIIPIGALVEYLPFSEKDKSRIHQFGKKVLLGIFLGYALIAGRIWKGDILIADIDELKKLDASEIYSRRLNAKEVLITQKDGEFLFPVALGSAKLSGRDYEFQEPTLRRESTVRRETLSGESRGDREEFQPEDSKDDAEIRNDFWSIQMKFNF